MASEPRDADDVVSIPETRVGEGEPAAAPAFAHARYELDLAMATLQLFVDRPAFVDVDWLRRCPLLAPPRERPELAEVERATAARAAAIWR